MFFADLTFGLLQMFFYQSRETFSKASVRNSIEVPEYDMKALELVDIVPKFNKKAGRHIG